MTEHVSTSTVKTPAERQIDAEMEELLAFIEEDDAPAAASAEDQSAVIAELEREEAKAEIYAEQDAEASAAAEETLKAVEKTEAERAAKPAKEKKARKSSSGVKRVSTIGLNMTDAIKAIGGEKWDSFLAFDASDGSLDADAYASKIEDRLKTMGTLAKKEQKKVINAIRWLANGSKLETYTKTAIDLLIDKGEITSTDIKAMYLSHPYSEGTANSQTNQVMHVLPALEIATLIGRKLVLNAESTIVQLIKSAGS